MTRFPTEKDLLEGLNSYTAHADELAVISSGEMAPGDKYKEAAGDKHDDSFDSNEPSPSGPLEGD